MTTAEKMKSPDTSRVLVCGIVRDAAAGLRRNVPALQRLLACFADYRVAVYENDSRDDTVRLLHAWERRDAAHVRVRCQVLGRRTIPTAHAAAGANPFFTLVRNERMSAFRNACLDMGEAFCHESGFVPDYMIVVDLDVVSLPSPASLLTCWDATAPAWDACTAYGQSRTPLLLPRYHDTYALCMQGDEARPQTEAMIRHQQRDMVQRLRQSPWLPVFSAFGGFAIYRYQHFQGLRYQALPNDDSRVESRAEHFSLFRQRPARTYVNAAMTLRYQAVTPALILSTLRRWFTTS